MKSKPIFVLAAPDVSRRGFLRTALLLAGGAGMPVLPPFLREALAATADRPSEGAIQYALELDGQFADFLATFSGSLGKSDVVATPVADTAFFDKRPGMPEAADFGVQVSGNPSAATLRWIAGFLDGTATPRNAAIVGADARGAEFGRFPLTNAQLTRMTLPALDAAAGREPGQLGLRLTTDRPAVPSRGGGGRVGGGGRQDRGWSRGNFLLSITGLEVDCRFVTRIEEIAVWRRPVAEGPTGASRLGPGRLGPIEISNLAFHVPEARAAAFYRWFDDAVVRGNAGERSGTLDLLGANLRDVILRFRLANLGIVGCRVESAADGGRGTNVRVEAYVERLTLDVGAAGAPVKREAGSGGVGLDVLKGFNQ